MVPAACVHSVKPALWGQVSTLDESQNLCPGLSPKHQERCVPGCRPIAGGVTFWMMNSPGNYVLHFPPPRQSLGPPSTT